MINYTPRLFVVVGSPASGKDELIKAVNILGSIHAQIVPKYTNRDWRWNDDEEMICERIPDNNGNMVRNPDYDIGNCDIIYCNYGTIYGIKTNDIWEGLKAGVHQVLVVSNIDALNKLKEIFGELAVFLYVYSEIQREDYLKKEYEKLLERGDVNEGESNEYLKKREENFDMAWHLYERNLNLFNHVFIFTNKEEDLFDQIFRLFRYYENRSS